MKWHARHLLVALGLTLALGGCAVETETPSDMPADPSLNPQPLPPVQTPDDEEGKDRGDATGGSSSSSSSSSTGGGAQVPEPNEGSSSGGSTSSSSSGGTSTGPACKLPGLC